MRKITITIIMVPNNNCKYLIIVINKCSNSHNRTYSNKLKNNGISKHKEVAMQLDHKN